jgi:hypothetical protein
LDQEKHPLPKTSTDKGRTISTKPAIENAPFSIHDNLNLHSNVTEESDSHSEKQFAPENRTELGTLTKLRDARSNVCDSILSNLD